MALPVAADDERQFTLHAVVDTPCAFMVYTKHPIWMENSNVMDLLLDEDKYIVVWFNLASHRVLCSRVPARALLSRPCACSALAPLRACFASSWGRPMITFGAPYACSCATRVAPCSYVLHD